MKCRAIQNGTLPGQGLIVKGDTNIEWDVKKHPRGFLVPMGEDDPTEHLNRESVIAELKRLSVKFFKGASTEQLQSLVMAHKGIQ